MSTLEGNLYSAPEGLTRAQIAARHINCPRICVRTGPYGHDSVGTALWSYEYTWFAAADDLCEGGYIGPIDICRVIDTAEAT